MNDQRSWFTGVRVSRRRLLRASVASTTLVTGSILSGGLFRRDAAADRVVALLPMTSAAAIGRAYLATGPVVADLASVRGALREKVPRLFGSDASSDRRLRELLDARTRADFGVGDVVRVEGWILARTEALLCAYVALLHDGPL